MTKRDWAALVRLQASYLPSWRPEAKERNPGTETGAQSEVYRAAMHMMLPEKHRGSRSDCQIPFYEFLKVQMEAADD